MIEQDFNADADCKLATPAPESASLTEPAALAVSMPRNADSSVADAGDEGAVEQRLRRLQQFVDEALTHSDAEVAMLGCVSGLLMRMLFALSDSIERMLEGRTLEGAELDDFHQALSTVLRLTRQIERFSHLRLMLERLARDTTHGDAKARRELTPRNAKI